MNQITQAVRGLRERLGDTQQSFAHRLNMAIATVVRYESSRPPQGEALGAMYRVARDAGHQDLAERFWCAMLDELGITESIGRRINDATVAIHVAETLLASLRHTLNSEQRAIADRIEMQLAEAIKLDTLDPYHVSTKKGSKAK